MGSQLKEELFMIYVHTYKDNILPLMDMNIYGQ